MHPAYDPNSYRDSCFDADMCLKPSLLQWLCVIFLCRSLLMPLVVGLGHFAGVNADVMTMMRSLWSVQGVLPALAAAPVLVAMIRRAPGAPGVLRRIWAAGRVLLVISALVDLGLAVAQLLRPNDFGDQAIAILCTGTADLYFIVYLVAARRVRDTFSDFPI